MLLDLVAQRGGPLELELLGRLAHLRLHPGDERLDLLAVRLVERRRPTRPAPRCRRSVDSATARSRSLRSWMPLTIVVGSMPCSGL